MEKIICAFDDMLEKLSRWGIIACLYVILSFAVLSIVLRWLGIAPPWIEPMIRHIVFLSAFFGGSLATSKNVHIKVDVLTKIVENSTSKILHWFHRNFVSLFCLLVTSVLMKSSFDFFLVEKEFGSQAFLGIHSSWLVGIIPFGMGLITLRFFNQLILGIIKGDASEHHRV
jgi:TRAP-type C4-dicarboxylate transport system permease small subunit